MRNITLSDAESRLLIELLELASDTFANHGSNDFNLAAIVPSLEDRRALMKAFNEYNGSPEDFIEDEKRGAKYEMGSDTSLMSYLAHRVREQVEGECQTQHPFKRGQHVLVLEPHGYAGHKGRVTNFHGDVDGEEDQICDNGGGDEVWVDFDGDDGFAGEGSWISPANLEILEDKER